MMLNTRTTWYATELVNKLFSTRLQNINLHNFYKERYYYVKFM